MTKTYDFATMTGPQLVEAYNEMALTAIDLGVQTARPVARFSGVEAGRSRCEKMHALVQDLAAQAHAEVSGPAEGRPETFATAEPLAQTQDQEGDLRAPLFSEIYRGYTITVRGVLVRVYKDPLQPERFTTTSLDLAMKWVDQTKGQATTRADRDQAIHQVMIDHANPAPEAETREEPASAGSSMLDAPPAQSGAESEEDDMAKKAKSRKAPRAKNGSGENLHSYTEAWNKLVPRAAKLGIKGAKHHSSDFESYEKAKARVKWLEQQIAKA